MAAAGVPVIWQVTLPATVAVATLRLAGRSGLSLEVSTAQLAASPPVLVKTMAGLASSPAIKMRAWASVMAGAGSVVVVGAMVIRTMADEDPKALVATIVTSTEPSVGPVGVPVI